MYVQNITHIYRFKSWVFFEITIIGKPKKKMNVIWKQKKAFQFRMMGFCFQIIWKILRRRNECKPRT